MTKYKYNEGFTNALRRTVYMKDLFPGMVASKDAEEEEGEKEEDEKEAINANNNNTNKNRGEEAMMV